VIFENRGREWGSGSCRGNMGGARQDQGGGVTGTRGSATRVLFKAKQHVGALPGERSRIRSWQRPSPPENKHPRGYRGPPRRLRRSLAG